jgi:hypothetical protein
MFRRNKLPSSSRGESKLQALLVPCFLLVSWLIYYPILKMNVMFFRNVVEPVSEYMRSQPGRQYSLKWQYFGFLNWWDLQSTNLSLRLVFSEYICILGQFSFHQFPPRSLTILSSDSMASILTLPLNSFINGSTALSWALDAFSV